MIGSSTENMQLFSKTKTANPDYAIANDEEYKLPVFKIDTAAYKNNNHRKKRERKSLFMGEVAGINSGLLAMDTISYFNYNQAQKAILDMNGNNYKVYCLDIMKKEKEVLSQFANNNQVSKKALKIKNMQIHYRAYESILSFNRMKSYAYRKKNKVPREQREIPLKPETFEPAFYDFINPDDLNNPISLISGSAYNSLINRIRFSESVRPKSNFVYIALKDSIVAKNVSLTK